MLAWLLMAAQDATLVERASRALLAERRCPVEETTDVTVCGLRQADRYRVPFVVHDAGDPRWEGVAAERARWLKRPSPIEALSPFLVGGGMAGMHAKISPGGVQVAPLRPLAP